MKLNFEEMICDYINNTESEEYCNLTDEEVDEVAKNVVESVVNDSDLQRVINSTIEYYVNRYLYNKRGK